jgi:hypothetical protein
MPDEDEIKEKFGKMIYYNMFGHHAGAPRAQAQANQPPNQPAGGAPHP